jgi:hypothetical protein
VGLRLSDSLCSYVCESVLRLFHMGQQKRRKKQKEKKREGGQEKGSGVCVDDTIRRPDGQ